MEKIDISQVLGGKRRVSLKEVQEFLSNIINNKNILSDKEISFKNINYYDPVLLAWIYLLGGRNFIPPIGNEYFKFYQLLLLLEDVELHIPKYEPDKSKYFLPILLIDDQRFEDLFNKNFNDVWEKFRNLTKDKNVQQKLKKDIERIGDSDRSKKLMNSLNNIIKNSKNKSLTRSEKSVLLYFLESLRSLALTRKIFDILLNSDNWKGRPVKLGIPGFSSKDDVRYEKKLMAFVGEHVIPNPYSFIYLFSLYIRNFYNIYPQNRKLKPEEVISDMHSLFDFCQKFYLGLKELAKNIVEHVGKGAIVIRVYEKRDHKEENVSRENVSNFVDDLKRCSDIDEISWPSGETAFKGIFTAYVIDIGRKGIIKTSIEKMEKRIDTKFWHPKGDIRDEVEKNIKKEIEKLKNGEIVLKDFYDYSEGIKMTHQRIRTAAGIGLLTFAKLISSEENKGLMWVSSLNKDDISKMDSVIMYEKFWSKSNRGKVIFRETEKYLFPLGTSYLFVLPVPYEKNSSFPSITIKSQAPKGNSAYEEMLSYMPAPEHEDFKYITTDRVLVKFSVPSNQIVKEYGKLEELWIRKKSKLEELWAKSKPAAYIVWVKPEYSPDPSDIFHLLSSIELITNASAIILSNVSKESIEFFIKYIFSIYHKESLWSNECYSLIFPSDPTLPPLLIGGEKIGQLKLLNSKIAKYYNENPWMKILTELGEG